MKKITYMAALVALSAAVAFLVSAVMLDDAGSGDASLSLRAEADTAAVPSIAERLSPSVVGVSSLGRSHAFSAPQNVESMGSGIVVSTDGYVLTNQHVVGDRSEPYVTLFDGNTVPAKRIWSDSALDLAVLKIDARGLSPAPLGDAATLSVGDAVLAIGNPLSLQFQRTVTAGIVSAKDRTLFLPEGGILMENLIQTDASINPGNSGGPLINMRGEVVGINTIKAQDAEGIGFAISINICRPILERIFEEGKYEMPYLGIYALDAATARYMGVRAPENGLYVSEVAAGSPARLAGLCRGDIITAIENTPLTRMAELREALLYYRAGDEVHLDVNRDGTLFTATVSLSSPR